MSKTSKRSARKSRMRGVVDRLATTDIVTQLECAVRNRPAKGPTAKATSYAMVAPIWRRATLNDVADAEIVSQVVS